MSVITVRQAAFQDVDALALLFDQYRQFQRQRSDIGRAATFLRERFDHGDSVIFIALDGSRAVGFAQLYPTYSSVALRRVFVLNDLFVHPSARRSRVATSLLEAVEVHAWAFDAARITLSVATDNPTARALYEALDWKQDNEFRVFHKHAHSSGRAPGAAD